MSGSLLSISRRRIIDEPRTGLLDRKVAMTHGVTGRARSAATKGGLSARNPVTLRRLTVRQLNDNWAIERHVPTISYPVLKDKLAPFREKNPFDSKKSPREYMAWYHKHHPGYFARKNKEWLDRKPKKDKLALFAEKNMKNRSYIAAFTKLRKRMRGIAHSRPTFTAEETDIISRYPRLSDMYRRVMSEHPS